MGYRSEVAFVIEQGDKPVFLNLLKQYDKEHPDGETAEDLLRYADTYNNVKGNNDKEYFVIHWDWVKWYDSYKSVQFFSNFYQYDSTADDVEYDFLRIGEEAGDIEEHGSLHSGVIVPWVEQRIELYDGGGVTEW